MQSYLKGMRIPPLLLSVRTRLVRLPGSKAPNLHRQSVTVARTPARWNVTPQPIPPRRLVRKDEQAGVSVRAFKQRLVSPFDPWEDTVVGGIFCNRLVPPSPGLPNQGSTGWKPTLVGSYRVREVSNSMASSS